MESVTKQNVQPVPQKASHAERFTKAVEREFSDNGGKIVLTDLQRKLIQNYFLKIDFVLKDAEVKRMKKSEKYREPLSYTWENINMQKLANDVITFSAIGMDPTQDNHINPIPYKNANTNKYDISFIPGYKGIEIKARKYGLDVPDNVVVEVVYSNDEFKEYKKDRDNKFENYHFKVTNSFDRGEIIGGFYFHEFFDQPEKNKIRTFSKKDIDKRRPKHASADFWGGEKDNWVDGKKSGTVEVEGWYDEMAYKTIYRAAYNSITIDSEKIDENYLAVIQRERESRDLQIELEIKENANKKEIGFEDIDHNPVLVLNEKTSNESKSVEAEPQRVEEKKESPAKTATSNNQIPF